jgi:nitrate reductase gamma subunit
MTDYLLFVVFPYIALTLAITGGLYRYFSDRFSFSSVSSQLIENRVLFWGSVLFHYGITIVLLIHIFSIFFADQLDRILGFIPVLYVSEIIGIGLGLIALFGLIALILRRMIHTDLIYESTAMDWVLLLFLLIQVATGLHTSVTNRWGALWYLHTAVPWLISLAFLNPEPQYMSSLPWTVKVHAVNAFVIIGLFPFTRLVHIFTVPITYLWRPFQVVIWNRRRPYHKGGN